MDFGTHYMQYGAWPITQTITITNNGAYQIGYDYSCGPYYEDKYVLEIHHPGLVEPGESGEITVSLWPKSVASGPVSVDVKFVLTGYPSKAGNPDLPGLTSVYLTISNLFTVDFEVKSPKDADAGDIAWDVSADALDFGVVDFPYEETEGGYRIVPSYEYRSQELTVTNQGPLPFTLEAEVDTSACQNPDASKTFSAGYVAVQVDSGKTYIITVSAPGGDHTEGLVEGCVLKLTAYYPDTKEKNTLTAEIPLSIKYLYDGGYQVLNVSDNSFGTVKTSDGVDRNPYSVNSLLLVKEGGSVTFVMTPYDPTAYHVSDIKLNGESVGTSGLVNNTYTISDIRENYRFEAIFAPGADPNAQSPRQQSAGGTAYASTQNVLVDGSPVEFLCYALKDEKGNDTNYVKLRDVAQILNGTAAEFEVGWDGAVNIETGKAYTPNGSEMKTPFSGNRAYETATAPTNVNGQTAALEAIVLTDDAGGAYTYYKLRDLGTALDFRVDWSAEKGIFIETK